MVANSIKSPSKLAVLLQGGDQIINDIFVAVVVYLSSAQILDIIMVVCRCCRNNFVPRSYGELDSYTAYRGRGTINKKDLACGFRVFGWIRQAEIVLHIES